MTTPVAIAPDASNPEDARQLALLRLAPGQAWSGRARYGAAMYFYQRGLLSAEALEAFRICSRLDAEAPSGLLAQTGAVPAWVAPEAEELALSGPRPQTTRNTGQAQGRSRPKTPGATKHGRQT